MEPEVKEMEAPAVVETPSTIKMDHAGSLAPMSSDANSEQWREIAEKTYSVLATLPEYIGKFFTEYRKPLVTVGLIFGSIVSVKLTLALLGAINDVPLLQPTFELVGLGYSIWFVYRYLLKASHRQELGQEFNKLKDQVIGRVSQ
ncbi:CAAD domain-containing protein [Leptolyngbya sp. AN03gr2]|uniref:CAAD domain-containing protein n=1 Tax=unclassified Leptolyngbya TaxID=2650499 RepID=UPI003D315B1C